MKSGHTQSSRFRQALLLLTLAFACVSLITHAADPEQYGDIDSDGTPSIFDAITLINHIIGDAFLSENLKRFADINQDGKIDNADVQILANAIVGKTDLPFPTPIPSVSATEPVTNNIQQTFTGTTVANAQIEVVGGDAFAEATANANGAFSVVVTLKANRLNRLYFIAFDAGVPSAPRVVAVTHDAQAPFLHIDVPADNAELTNATVVVIGRVGDTLSGFMGLAVTVNGEAANVAVGIGTNGTYEKGGIPLTLGANAIQVIATDAHGNEVTKNINVTRVALSGPRMAIISGNLQEGIVAQPLPAPIVVQVTEEDGGPIANKIVTFQITRNDGMLHNSAAYTNPTRRLQVSTDGNGLARAFWRLGVEAGCGNNRVEISSRDIDGTIGFCASATPLPVAKVNIASGNNQTCETSGPAPQSLRAWANDGCNGVANIPLTFTIIEGGGKVNAEDSVSVNTAITGHAQVQFTAGPDPGRNLVEVTYDDDTPPATFIISALKREDGATTRFTGVVHNNANQPIAGCECKLVIDGTEYVQTSAADGTFTMDNIAESGHADLFVDGLNPATQVNGDAAATGRFPTLHFEPTIIPQALNTLGDPIRLPPLDPQNAEMFDNSQDVPLTIAGIEGLKMIVKAGSMTLKDGSVPSPGNATLISLNKVNTDKIPMAFPDGAAPPVAWTLQPGGATFDPPVEIQYPNLAGLAPGSVVYFLSFNHDTNKFEIVATGHVIEDGSLAVTDPDSGISTAGWGGLCPPYPNQGQGKNCTIDCTSDGTLTPTFFGGGPVAGSDPAQVNVGDRTRFFVAPHTDSRGTYTETCIITQYDEEGNVTGTTQVVTNRNTGGSRISYNYTIKDASGAIVRTGASRNFIYYPRSTGVHTCTWTITALRNCPPPSKMYSASVRVFDLKDLEARDNAHAPAMPERVAHAGETLHLVDHGNVLIRAIPDGADFPTGAPVWSGSPGTPAPGIRSFVSDSISNRTFTAGSKSVSIVHHNKDALMISPPWDPIGISQELKDKLKFDAGPVKFAIKVPSISIAASAENAEVEDDIGYGTKYSVVGSFTGAGISGRIEHPAPLSGQVPPFIDSPWLEWALYLGADLTLGLTAGVEKLPEKSWVLIEGSPFVITLTGTVQGGFDASANFPWIVFSGDANLQTVFTSSQKLNIPLAQVEAKVAWSGISANLVFSVQSTDAPPKVYYNYTKSWLLMSGSDTGWIPFPLLP